MDYGEENHLEFLKYKDPFGYNKIDTINHGNMKITFCKNPHDLNTYSTKIEHLGVGILFYCPRIARMGLIYNSFFLISVTKVQFFFDIYK